MKLRYLLGVLVVVAMIAAACAPAANPPPRGEQPSSQPAVTGDQKPAGTESKAPGQSTAGDTKPAGASVPPGEVGAKFGGVLVVSGGTPPPGWIVWEENLVTVTQPNHMQGSQIVQYQTWGNFDDQDYLNIVGDAAKSWEQSPDGLSWTFRFHDGIKWSDGQPWTCTDVKWSLDTVRTGTGLARSPRAALYSAVGETRCVDPLTLVVQLKRPQSDFIHTMAAGPLIILAKHAYDSPSGIEKARNDPRHVSSGPFIGTDYLPGEKRVYTKNPNYWKKPYPFLDGVEEIQLATAAVAPALRANRLHMGGPTGFGGAGANNLVRECQTCQFGKRFVQYFWAGMQVNHQRPPWNTPEIKDAIGYSIDPNRWVSVCLDGWGVPGLGFIHPESPNALPKEILEKYAGYKLDDPAGNKQKGRDALARAGYRPGELTMSLPVWKGSQVEALIPCYKEDFETVGFNFVPTTYETARMYEINTAGDFDVTAWQFLSAMGTDDATFYEHFYTGSDRNYGRYSNPEVDRLIDRQSATLDPAERKKLIWQVSEIILKEQGKLQYYWFETMPIMGKSVRNYMSGPTCTAHGRCESYERVWLDQ